MNIRTLKTPAPPFSAIKEPVPSIFVDASLDPTLSPKFKHN